MPRAHTRVSDKASWEPIEDDLPQFPEWAPKAVLARAGLGPITEAEGIGDRRASLFNAAWSGLNSAQPRIDAALLPDNMRTWAGFDACGII